MLVGSADIDELKKNAGTIPQFSADDIILGDTTCFQLVAEMDNTAREALLPSALHPTIPASMVLQVFNVRTSVWGEFLLALMRVSCRSGVRARGFTLGAMVTTEKAQKGLGHVLGLATKLAVIDMEEAYAETRIRVLFSDTQILEIQALDPEPLSTSDLQFTGTLNLANTPNGLRLVQVECIPQLTRVERLQSTFNSFQGEYWGSPLLQPTQVVTSTISRGDFLLPAIRFVCKPDELAFTGTESVK
jgi:hypothetical protein